MILTQRVNVVFKNKESNDLFSVQKTLILAWPKDISKHVLVWICSYLDKKDVQQISAHHPMLTGLCSRSVKDHGGVQENSSHRYTLQFVPDQSKTQKMCDEVVSMGWYSLLYVPNHFMNQEMYNKAAWVGPHWYCFLQMSIRPKRCATKQYTWSHTHCNLSLIALNYKKCLSKQWKKTLTPWSMSLIGFWWKSR